MSVSVLERQPEVAGAGAGISLWSNALRTLDRLGIDEWCQVGGVIGGRSGVRPSGRRCIAQSSRGFGFCRRRTVFS